jgi:hypothetical protein
MRQLDEKLWQREHKTLITLFSQEITPGCSRFVAAMIKILFRCDTQIDWIGDEAYICIEAKAAELFARFKKNGTWPCLTLTALRAFHRADPNVHERSVSQVRFAVAVNDDAPQERSALQRLDGIRARMGEADLKASPFYFF